MVPTVTVITPTYGRQGLLPRLHADLRAQTVDAWEWLVFDDGGPPSAYMQGVAAPNIRYIHASDRFAIGEKRNVMAEMARGAAIVHCDDDDHYAPRYLETMLRRLDGGLDFVKLSAWFVADAAHRAFGYWDCRVGEGLHLRWSRRGAEAVELAADPVRTRANRLGFGFSYAYRKSVWAAHRFPPVNGGEDLPFAMAAAAAVRHADFADEEGLALHVLHGANTSLCFPQYRLPDFLLDRLFGPAGRAAVEAVRGTGPFHGR